MINMGMMNCMQFVFMFSSVYSTFSVKYVVAG